MEAQLKFKVVKLVEYSDFNTLVTDTYGRPYDFQQQEGCKGTGLEKFIVPDFTDDYEDVSIPEVINTPEMGVSFDAWKARDPKQSIGSRAAHWEIEMWWQRNFYPHPQMILNDLYQKGLIKADEYYISID